MVRGNGAEDQARSRLLVLSDVQQRDSVLELRSRVTRSDCSHIYDSEKEKVAPCYPMVTPII